MKIGYIFTKQDYDKCYIWCKNNNATIKALENNTFQIIEKPNEDVDIIGFKKAIRNKYLNLTDKYVLFDYPISSSERNLYIEYRKYLRDYPTMKGFPDINVLSFDEWKNKKI